VLQIWDENEIRPPANSGAIDPPYPRTTATHCAEPTSQPFLFFSAPPARNWISGHRSVYSMHGYSCICMHRMIIGMLLSREALQRGRAYMDPNHILFKCRSPFRRLYFTRLWSLADAPIKLELSMCVTGVLCGRMSSAPLLPIKGGSWLLRGRRCFWLIGLDEKYILKY
jgi:hypothetical protein